ncbi:hypothetical protein [Nonlabens ponticola]|uniref:Uncharacterized protein n=1 Tax=Nonlabens ponticola TaxID=2496866 RepID=A0A3S9MY26_9FLAO|nr:hypothetical protein [Nonlabens ponticola]AZQ43953.1 hypothetical protein EJ995_06790 [Nonlabens ponticola]
MAHIVSSCGANNVDKNSQKEDWTLDYERHGFLNTQNIDFLKKYYDWNDEELLYIFAMHDPRICGFRRSELPTAEQRIAESRNTENIYFDYIIQDSKKVVHVDLVEQIGVNTNKLNKDFHPDYNNYLQKNFFTKPDNCIAILVINQKGEYYQDGWHISKEQISNYSLWLTEDD